VSQFGRLADGRRKNTPAVNRTHYWHGVPGVLVGKDGTIAFVTSVDPQSEMMLDRQISAALDK
jgi:hypothetical protein